MSERRGEDLQIHLRHYHAMDGLERQAFQQLVETGGEVRTDGLPDRMKAAHLLGYAMQNNRLEAVGAVKHPAESYVHKISQGSGYDLQDYTAELGWIYVMREARGIHLASRISKALCNS